MLDVFSICTSPAFLNGAYESNGRESEIPQTTSWSWAIRSPEEFKAAFEKKHNDSSIVVLNKYHLDEYSRLFGELLSYSDGPVLEQVHSQRRELSELLASSQPLQLFLTNLAARTTLNRALVKRELAELPYYHLSVATAADCIAPSLSFPLLDILSGAYSCGLFPYGLSGMHQDENHTGPEIVDCINPQDLL